MAQQNKIPFDDTTNYPDVYRITKLMRGDIVARGSKCCQSQSVKDALCEANPMIDAAQTALDLSDQERYEHAVKGAYLTLYPYSGDEDYDYQPLTP